MSATYETRFIPLDKLFIDAPARQRKLRRRRVEQIAREFDVNSLQQATVSERPDGTLVLLDGQHRKAAMELRISRGLETPTELDCKVFTGLTEQEESRLFVTLNTTAAPSPLDRWFPRLAAEDDAVIAKIDEALKRWRWVIDGVSGKGHIVAVAALEQVAREGIKMGQKFKMDVDLVDLTLQVITEAWGWDPAGVRGEMLRGVAAMLSEYPTADLKRLARKLKERPGGPVSLLANAKANAAIRSLPPAMSIADLMVITYNKDNPKAKLADWTRRN